MTDQLDALRTSVERLRRLTKPLTGEQLRASAYPSDWTIADVLSHVGSGAEIMGLRLQAEADGAHLADDFAQPIWDVWNAKSPEAKAADALEADHDLLGVVDSLTAEQRAAISIDLGPMRLDYASFFGLRLNEHALHTWDIEVALDPTATIPEDAAAFIVDQLEMMARFSGKPTPAQRNVHITTTDPARAFTLSLGGDSVTLAPAASGSPSDLELPAEALIRLVYGRLDVDHTPPVRGDVDLDGLRRALPGV